MTKSNEQSTSNGSVHAERSGGDASNTGSDAQRASDPTTHNDADFNNPQLVDSQTALLNLLANAQNANQPADDEIDLRELWNAIWQGKLLIIAITFAFAVGGVIFALSQPNQYKATALLAPAQSESGAGSLAAKFGGLASLAGINLGGAGGENKSLLAQQVLKSRQFVAEFINEHDLLVPLMASEGWDPRVGALIIDDDVYDYESKQWTRLPDTTGVTEPSMWDAYESFTERLSVSEAKDSGYVTLSFEFYSPTLAKQWVDWMVVDINNQIRQRDVKEAKESIAFLEKKLQETTYAEMQRIFFQLIEEQTKTIMLAEVRAEYVFKTVDPAVVPEEKSKPKRALISLVATILGGVLSILFVIIRHLTKRANASESPE